MLHSGSCHLHSCKWFYCVLGNQRRGGLPNGAAMPVGELQEGLHLRQGLPVNVADEADVLAGRERKQIARPAILSACDGTSGRRAVRALRFYLRKRRLLGVGSQRRTR